MKILSALPLILILAVCANGGVFKIAEGWQNSFAPYTNSPVSRGIEAEVVAYRTVPKSVYVYLTSTPPHAEMSGEFIISYNAGKGSLWAFFTDLQQSQDLATLNDCYFGSRMGLPVIHYRWVATRSAGNIFNNNVVFYNYCTTNWDTWYDHTWSYGVGTTTLSGNIDSSQTTITLASGAYPWEPGPVVKIDNEFIRLVSQAGNVFTVVRAVDGSTAAAHTSGATVSYAYFDCVNRDVCDGWVGAFEELNGLCQDVRIPPLGYFNFKYQIDGGAWTALTATEGNGKWWSPGFFCPQPNADYSPWSLLFYQQYASWIVGQPASGISGPSTLVTTQFASGGATSIVVGAFHGPISSGSVLSFASGKTATTTSNTPAGTLTLPVSALAQSISLGDSAPMPSTKIGLQGATSSYGRADISQGNLLINPGFESASGGWDGGSALADRSSTFAHAGTFSLKSINEYSTQTFSVTVGDKVHVSAWVKVTQTSPSEVTQIGIKDVGLSSYYLLISKTAVADWTFVEDYFLAPSTGQLKVVIESSSNTIGYWDDVVVEVVK